MFVASFFSHFIHLFEDAKISMHSFSVYIVHTVYRVRNDPLWGIFFFLCCYMTRISSFPRFLSLSVVLASHWHTSTYSPFWLPSHFRHYFHYYYFYYTVFRFVSSPSSLLKIKCRITKVKCEKKICAAWCAWTWSLAQNLTSRTSIERKRVESIAYFVHVTKFARSEPTAHSFAHSIL